MSENRDPLYQTTPPQSSASRAAAEQLLLQTLTELIVACPDERIHVLRDTSLAGIAGADFLLQVDDYDLRLILLDASGFRLQLDIQRLQSAAHLLEDNPSTLAILLVWAAEGLPAVPLSLTRIRYLIKNSDKIPDLLRHTRPVKEVAEELIHRQTHIWSANLTEIPEGPHQGLDIYQIFADEIGRAIDAESHRRYVNEERRQAAQAFPYQPEKQLILSVLQDALHGIESGKLVERLVRVQDRSLP